MKPITQETQSGNVHELSLDEVVHVVGGSVGGASYAVSKKVGDPTLFKGHGRGIKVTLSSVNVNPPIVIL